MWARGRHLSTVSGHGGRACSGAEPHAEEWPIRGQSQFRTDRPTSAISHTQALCRQYKQRFHDTLSCLGVGPPHSQLGPERQGGDGRPSRSLSVAVTALAWAGVSIAADVIIALPVAWGLNGCALTDTDGDRIPDLATVQSSKTPVHLASSTRVAGVCWAPATLPPVKTAYRDLCPGIDHEFYGQKEALKRRFAIHGQGIFRPKPCGTPVPKRCR